MHGGQLRKIVPPPQCRHGHDLTIPENVRVEEARWRCLACMREDARIRRRNQSQHLMHAKCKVCGRKKWTDRRTKCLKCAHEEAKSAAPVEVRLSLAVTGECLMPWDRPKRSAELAPPCEPRLAGDVPQ